MKRINCIGRDDGARPTVCPQDTQIHTYICVCGRRRLRVPEGASPAGGTLRPDLHLGGTHSLQNPRHCWIVQEGAVDWVDFWLNGRADPDPRKEPQYQHWRELRTLQEKLIKDRHAAGEQVADLPTLR